MKIATLNLTHVCMRGMKMEKDSKWFRPHLSIHLGILMVYKITIICPHSSASLFYWYYFLSFSVQHDLSATTHLFNMLNVSLCTCQSTSDHMHFNCMAQQNETWVGRWVSRSMCQYGVSEVQRDMGVRHLVSIFSKMYKTQGNYYFSNVKCPAILFKRDRNIDLCQSQSVYFK